MRQTAKPSPSLAVSRLEGPRFEVGSASVPGQVYEVDLAASSCTCEAGQRGRRCKHVVAAIAFHEAEQKQLAMILNGVEQPLAQQVKPRSSRLDKMGYQFDEVASALQKEIRRGDEEAAVYWGLLLHDASPHYVWKRVLITAAEDVGLAAPGVVAQVSALAQAWSFCRQNSWYVSPHHLTMAIVLLCRSPKSTEVEDLQSLTLEGQKRGEKREMPEYALDAHTKAGKQAGASWSDWYRDRHKLFGVPVNQYTEKLWALVPEWRPPA